MADVNMQKMIEKMMPFYNEAERICVELFRSGEKMSPFSLLEKLMDMPSLPMHCPPHHYIMPAVLLTAAAMENGTPEDLYLEQMSEAKDRAVNVLGGFCGWYGTCGAAVGVGIFTSIYTDTNPHSVSNWAQCNRATACALMDISGVEGPRCCKRNSFFALLSAIDTANSVLGLHLEKPEKVRCKYFANNKGECKEEKCPFFPKEKNVEICIPERLKPENKDGKNCDCMNREYLVKYKKGVMHWLKAEGDAVNAGDTVCEIEVEKKIFSVPAPVSGVMGEKLVEEEAEFACKDIVGYIKTNE